MFVVLSVTGSASGPGPLNLGSSILISGNRVYSSYTTLNRLQAETGFETSIDLAFEVDPRRIDDLTLELSEGEVLSGYHQRIRVPLGISTENADLWRGAAARQSVEVRPYGDTRVIP
jgi:hypothetical protein